MTQEGNAVSSVTSEFTSSKKTVTARGKMKQEELGRRNQKERGKTKTVSVFKVRHSRVRTKLTGYPGPKPASAILRFTFFFLYVRLAPLFAVSERETLASHMN